MCPINPTYNTSTIIGNTGRFLPDEPAFSTGRNSPLNQDVHIPPILEYSSSANFIHSPSLDHRPSVSTIVIVTDRELAYRERVLRKGIRYIQSQSHLSQDQKAKQIQNLMSADWTPTSNQDGDIENNSDEDLSCIISKMIESEIQSNRRDQKIIQRISSGGQIGYLMTEQDLIKSFHKENLGIFGCKNYARNCKIYSSCCEEWICCRLCHDQEKTHMLDRTKTEHMLCMFCNTPQLASKECNNCGEEMGRFYCDICKLWENNLDKKIFHCKECGICRIGEKNSFVHCSKCHCCLSKNFLAEHKCIERNLECNCPICGDYLFTSISPVMFMKCGHAIHNACFQRMELKYSHQCPVCQRSVRDMSFFHHRLDEVLAMQQMPEEYAKYRSLILCNDCGSKSEAPYHFLYHKCVICTSYNTTLLETIKPV